ncbi:MAG TPA: ATP-binding protein [Gemmatimonadaceae bacterium]|nr:ATP-binding protein [Gemmatimonadaceae bacterium]
MHDQPERPERAPRFERRVVLLAVLAGLPGGIVALLLIWFGDLTPRSQWSLTVLIVAAWAIVATILREQVVRPVQTLSNLLAALHEGDYTIRSRSARADDALGLAMLEVNALGDTLREQRMGALEATALLRSVIAEIDVAIFTFDEVGRLRLVNMAGQRLLGQPAERLEGKRAEELGLADALTAAPRHTLAATFPGATGKFEVRRRDFLQGGRRHRLLVLADVSATLREEERQAWQRIVRVLGHEINNSLAPIKSIAASLRGLLARPEPPADLQADLQRGLDVIGARSEALSRFMSAYARLARLPPVRPSPVRIADVVARVAALETRVPIDVLPGPNLTMHADADQLEQLLINLLRNAADASLETAGRVTVGWARQNGQLELRIEDEGPGLADTANLFVPFFTTKPSGTGIGLVLSRQIAEAHGGALELRNRAGRSGCEAVLRLPFDARR